MRAASLMAMARRSAAISSASLCRRILESAVWASTTAAPGKASRSASASKTRIRWPSTPIRAGETRRASAAKASA